MNKIFIIYLLFFSHNAHSDILNLCLKNPAQLVSAKSKINDILHNEDEVYIRDKTGCLEFVLNNKRSDLYNSYLAKFFDLKNIQKAALSKSIRSTPENCHFTYIQERELSNQIKSLTLGNSNKVGTSNKEETSVTRGTILVSQGKMGSLRVNGERAYMGCSKKGNTYEIEVTLSQSNSSLSTSINVRKGEKINLGSIVNNLSNRKRSVGLPDGFSQKHSKGSEVFNYYLILN